MLLCFTDQVSVPFLYSAEFSIKNAQKNQYILYRMDHTTILERLCRVCGRMLRTKSVKTVYCCNLYLEDLHTVFGLAGSDDPNTHPKHFCHACKVVVDKSKTGYRHNTTVFEGWGTHTEGNCAVCLHYQALQRGGRPKKAKRPGRPPTASPRYCIDRVHDIAPPPLILPDQPIKICDVHLHLPLSELNCPLCNDILNQPIQLVSCGSVVCAQCMCRSLEHQQANVVCPCCNTDHIKHFTSIREAPSLVVSSLKSLCVVCERCSSHTPLGTYKEHHCTPQAVSPNTSIEDVLDQPLSTPLTSIEQKLQTSLARRSMTGEKVLKLKTGGKVM